MKKLLFITLFLLAVFSSAAQTITITSFAKSENELEITSRKKLFPGSDKPFTDGNGDPMAMIKITRADNMPTEMFKQLGAEVPGQVLHRKFVENEGLYFYVSYTADQLTIYDTRNKMQHQSDIYNLKKHFQNVEITGEYGLDPNAVYEMTLKYIGGHDDSGEPIITEEFLDLTVEPKDAMVSVNGTFLSTDGGTVGQLLPVGRHTYSVSADMYHEEKGSFDITAQGKTVLTVKLKPNFGYLSLNSTPSGAIVYINGKNVGHTPYESDKMKSGTYQVQLVKEMYAHTAEHVVISDNQTTQKNITLSADFAEVAITTDSQADIYINNEYKAKGSWTGYLSAGMYIMEARRDAHSPSKANITLMKGENRNIALELPTPICGNISVRSTPPHAIVKIDGKESGETPQVFRNILIGEHVVEISKNGYTTQQQTVKVEDGKTTTIDATLKTGRKITITSEPSGAELFVDDAQIGTTPLTIAMGFGNHNLKAIKRQLYSQQTITVTENGNADFNLTNFKRLRQSFVTANFAYTTSPQLSYGLSFGMMREMGWYVSFMSNLKFLSPDLKSDADGFVDGIYPYYTSEKATSRMSVMAGGILNVADNLGLRLGVGYGSRLFCVKTEDGKWVQHNGYSAVGIDASIGAQLNFGAFILTLDAVSTNFKTLEAKIGIGFAIIHKK